MHRTEQRNLQIISNLISDSDIVSTKNSVQMDSGGECVEMDLSTTTRAHDVVQHHQENKMRVAKSVFSIRSLVDLGDNTDRIINGELLQ